MAFCQRPIEVVLGMPALPQLVARLTGPHAIRKAFCIVIFLGLTRPWCRCRISLRSPHMSWQLLEYSPTRTTIPVIASGECIAH
jgi:hypothetical protein